MSDQKFEHIDHDEAVRLLGEQHVGRVAFVAAGGLELLPVNYRSDGTSVYFFCATDSVLAQLADGVDGVVFQTDHHDDMFQHGWSIVAKGGAHRAEERPAVVDEHPALKPWAAGERPVLIVVEATSISGRRVRQR